MAGRTGADGLADLPGLQVVVDDVVDDVGELRPQHHLAHLHQVGAEQVTQLLSRGDIVIATLTFKRDVITSQSPNIHSTIWSSVVSLVSQESMSVTMEMQTVQRRSSLMSPPTRARGREAEAEVNVRTRERLRNEASTFIRTCIVLWM